MPFLRLTRDRRGFENTFLLHSDRPGDRPRLLYWYRTAPGIVLGRAPLDEDAIRLIEEQHPEIDFDWPAILALGEVMIHEDEAPVRSQKRGPKPRGRDQQPRERRPQPSAEPAIPEDAEAEMAEEAEADTAGAAEITSLGEPRALEEAPEEHPTTHGLLEELVGREIAMRLRARYAEISARIHEHHAEGAARDHWMHRAEPLDPDTWLTPEAILEGVRNADALFDRLRQDLLG